MAKETIQSVERTFQVIELLAEKGVTELVECGPGKVLAGLNRRCAKGINTHGLDGVEAFAATRAALA